MSTSLWEEIIKPQHSVLAWTDGAELHGKLFSKHSS